MGEIPQIVEILFSSWFSQNETKIQLARLTKAVWTSHRGQDIIYVMLQNRRFFVFSGLIASLSSFLGLSFFRKKTISGDITDVPNFSLFQEQCLQVMSQVEFMELPVVSEIFIETKYVSLKAKNRASWENTSEFNRINQSYIQRGLLSQSEDEYVNSRVHFFYYLRTFADFQAWVAEINATPGIKSLRQVDYRVSLKTNAKGQRYIHEVSVDAPIEDRPVLS